MFLLGEFFGLEMSKKRDFVNKDGAVNVYYTPLFRFAFVDYANFTNHLVAHELLVEEKMF